jgi:hypothetical protein
MSVVSEDRRLPELRRLGLSDALIRQSAGEQLHDLLWFRCKGPPWYVYHGAGFPDGPPLLPLWDCCDSVTGLWDQADRMEFLEFSIECPEEYTILAHTEQGLWATVFVDLYEDRDDLSWEDFRPVAQLVGFQYLDQLATEYEKASHQNSEDRQSFVQAAVARIDQWSANFE